MGTPDFAVPSLEVLHQNHYPIVSVVTGQDKPRGRGQAVTPTPVCSVARTLKLPLLQPSSFKDPSFIAALTDLRPDLFVVVAFRILPAEVFSIPKLGAFNLHASLLPRYRGAAPINWAIMNGEERTGVTTFLLKKKVDTGNLLLQKELPIEPEDNAGTLHDRLSLEGSMLVLETVRTMEEGMFKPREQDDSLATPAPKITKEDCRIDWTGKASDVHNRIRGLSPYPASFTLHRGKVLKIYRSAIMSDRTSGEPGTVTATPGNLTVETSDLPLSILDVRLEGKKRMKIDEFLRGYRFESGEKLE